MTHFITPSYSAAHRVESVNATTPEASQDFPGTRGLAMLLLSAMTAAVMAVAYEVMDTVAEGHLLVMWMILWAVLFAALMLLAGVARRIATRLKTSLDAWSHRVAQSRADRRLWALAQQDSRVMADLQQAIMRQTAGADVASDAAAPVQAVPEVKLTGFMAHPYARYSI